MTTATTTPSGWDAAKREARAEFTEFGEFGLNKLAVTPPMSVDDFARALGSLAEELIDNGIEDEETAAYEIELSISALMQIAAERMESNKKTSIFSRWAALMGREAATAALFEEWRDRKNKPGNALD